MTSNYLSGAFITQLCVTYTFFFFEINRTTDVSIWSQWMMRLRIYSRVSPRVAQGTRRKKMPRVKEKLNLCSTTFDPYFVTNAESLGLAQTISKESIRKNCII